MARFEHGSHNHEEQHGARAAAPAKSAQKPYIITKTQMQAQVFGLGYPSVPVYSIDQFYDQLVEKGDMPAISCGYNPNTQKGASFKFMRPLN